VIPSEWVAESTRIDRSTHRASYYPGSQDFYDSGGYYKYMWWGFSRGENSYDFSAEGDRGQMIYVSPEKKMIVVRNGLTYGDVDWWDLAYDLVGEIANP
jgi:CubicO group peptidase (beta-lactamase class C family)